MPTLHTPCGAIELPTPTRDRLQNHAGEWADNAGDAFVAGLTAMANGDLDKARECFLSARSALGQACNIIEDAVKLPPVKR